MKEGGAACQADQLYIGKCSQQSFIPPMLAFILDITEGFWLVNQLLWRLLLLPDSQLVA